MLWGWLTAVLGGSRRLWGVDDRSVGEHSLVVANHLDSSKPKSGDGTSNSSSPMTPKATWLGLLPQ